MRGGVFTGAGGDPLRVASDVLATSHAEPTMDEHRVHLGGVAGFKIADRELGQV